MQQTPQQRSCFLLAVVTRDDESRPKICRTFVALANVLANENTNRCKLPLHLRSRKPLARILEQRIEPYFAHAKSKRSGRPPHQGTSTTGRSAERMTGL